LALVVLCSDLEKMLLPPEAFEVGRGVSDPDRFLDSLPSHRRFRAGVQIHGEVAVAAARNVTIAAKSHAPTVDESRRALESLRGGVSAALNQAGVPDAPSAALLRSGLAAGACLREGGLAVQGHRRPPVDTVSQFHRIIAMKNITLSVPDEVYRKARLAAAKRETSVSAVVADSLRAFAAGEDPRTVRRRLLQKAFATAATGRAGRLPKREELYDRAVLA
jgi:hypothetical protein